MALKLLLKTNKPNKLGLFPIYLRITINRKISYLSTGHYIHKSLWDARNEVVKQTHPLADQINKDITNKKRDALNEVISTKNVSAATVKHTTKGKISQNDFFAFKDAYIKEVEENKRREPGTIKNWKKHLRKLKSYRATLNFEDITPEFLTEFEKWLRNGGVKVQKGSPENYIASIMRTMRRMFKEAIERKIISSHPFRTYKIPEPVGEEKEYLSIAELDKWEEFIKKTTDPVLKEVGTYFLFGCYTGLRLSDWYKFDRKKHLRHGYITLKTTKTMGDAVIPLHARLERVLKLMKMPMVSYGVAISEALKAICKELKIKKRITSHCARKTFAITMCAERGVSSETCATMLAITYEVCVSAYYRITKAKIEYETSKAWEGL